VKTVMNLWVVYQMGNLEQIQESAPWNTKRNSILFHKKYTSKFPLNSTYC